MAVFLQSMLSGILIGGVYALIGIGLTIIFGVMRVINFAHGDVLMIGMYMTYFLFTLLHIDPFVSIVVTIPLMFLFGAFLQKVFINRVLGALPQNQILLTIGMGLVMSNAVMLAFTSDYKILSTKYSSSSFNILGISISSPLLISFAITIIITVALYWLFPRFRRLQIRINQLEKSPNLRDWFAMMQNSDAEFYSMVQTGALGQPDVRELWRDLTGQRSSRMHKYNLA